MRLATQGYELEEVLRRRYFCVREVLFNTIHALGLQSLATLFTLRGDGQKADHLQNRVRYLEEAILQDSYDPNSGLYFD
jgi:hypothetical protein